ncbi:MAG: cation-translocating P-type ATPase, partial [Candidatus Methanomethylophilaceae archaeon]|nr:cation-translocating P-type ATPase [Candidatus Methanomethylophilaceae archaeon]
VSAAIIASILIGEWEAAAEICVIMEIGSFLEETAVSRARSSVRRLSSLKPSEARVVENGSERMISFSEVRAGQRIRIFPGETISVDGTVIKGSSSADTSVITGESLPRDIGPGDKVSCGWTNMYGSIDIIAECDGNSTVLSRMAGLLEDTDLKRSRTVRTADKMAVYIVAAAFLSSIAVYLMTSDIRRAVTVMVVFCPCALILATPTAVMAAAGNMSKKGILMKNADSVENLSAVKTIVLDKTGTLTTGVMKCEGIVSTDPSVPDKQLASLVCSLESCSEHPVGKAIAGYTEHSEPEDFRYVPGCGVSGMVGGETVFAGNRSFIKRNCPANFGFTEKLVSEEEEKGFASVLAGIKGKTLDYAVLSDAAKPSSRYAVRHFRMLRLRCVMLTGDSRTPASRICRELNLDDLVWECLPSDKMRIVSEMEKTGKCCMIGDGVNDALSLKTASVGISVGNGGFASEASDIVLTDGDLSKLPGLIVLSRRTQKTISGGIAFSLMLNTAATISAAAGGIGPVEGALIHNAGSVIVIAFAAMLLRYDPWKPGRHKKRKNAQAA